MTLPELTERELAIIRMGLYTLHNNSLGSWLDRPRSNKGHLMVEPETVEALLAKLPETPFYEAERVISVEEEEQLVRAGRKKREPDLY